MGASTRLRTHEGETGADGRDAWYVYSRGTAPRSPDADRQEYPFPSRPADTTSAARSERRRWAAWAVS